MRTAAFATAALTTTGSAVLVEKGMSLPLTVGLLVVSGLALGGMRDDTVGRGLFWAAGGLLAASGIDHLLSRK